MTSPQTENTPLLSPLLLAVLEDSGWYIANYTNTELSSFGRNAGCDFVYDDCIGKGGDVPPQSEGFFCNTTLTYTPYDTLVGLTTCDAPHLYKGQCNLVNYSIPFFASVGPVPGEDYQYFPDKVSYFSYIVVVDVV